jgi:hypothetical protein
MRSERLQIWPGGRADGLLDRGVGNAVLHDEGEIAEHGGNRGNGSNAAEERASGTSAAKTAPPQTPPSEFSRRQKFGRDLAD